MRSYGSDSSAGGGAGGTPEPAGDPITLDAENISLAAEAFRQDIASPTLFFETLRNLYTTPIPTFNLQDLSETVSCEVSGTATVTSRSSGREVDQAYNQCVQGNGETLNGTLSHRFTNVSSAANSYTMTITMDSLEVTSGQDTARLNGTSTLNAQFNNTGRVFLDGINNLTISTSELNLDIRSDDLSYSVNYPLYSDFDIVFTDVAGRVYQGDDEYITYTWSSNSQRVEMTGSGSEKGYIDVTSDRYSLEFVNADGDSNGIVVTGSDLETLDVFSGNNAAPVFRQSDKRLVAQSGVTTLNFEDWLFDPNFDVLTVSLSVSSAPDDAEYRFQNQGLFSAEFSAHTIGEYLIRVRAEDPEGLSIEGDIVLEFAVDTDGDGTIDLQDPDDDNDNVNDTDDAFPLDASESKDSDNDGVGDNADADDDNDGVDDVNDAFPFDQFESIDTDGDRIGNSADSDDDNDGVNDESDAFPLDAYEQFDTDNDGEGNNADTDDDNDGVEDHLDLFALNPLCQSSSQAIDGRCIYEVMAEADEVSVDSNGVIYLLIKESKKVIRWNTGDNDFLPLLSVGEGAMNSANVTQMEFSESHQRLYFGYDTGAVTFIDITATEKTETSLSTLPDRIRSIASAGDFLFIRFSEGHWDRRYVVNQNGDVTDQINSGFDLHGYTWDSTTNRLYHYTTLDDLSYLTVDQDNGLITNKGDFEIFDYYAFIAPPVVFDNGQFVLIGDGNIVRASDLSWSGAIPGGQDIKGSVWSPEDGLITLRSAGKSTTLERRDSNLSLLEMLELPGNAKMILKTANGFRILTEINGNLVITPYVPSNDTDGDGFVNNQDAFPNDPAASVDTDKDSYPDAWNPGYTEEDSNSNLSIDAYPNDSACHLPSHGDGENCNYALVIPSFEPGRILTDNSGIIYILSPDNNRVYRWALAAEGYISPLVVGRGSAISPLTPTAIEYSDDHNRLYLGYSNGDISYMDLSSRLPIEQSFVTVSAYVGGLASAGKNLLIQDTSGFWNTHYIYSIEGSLKDNKDKNSYSSAYAWNNSLNRVYFFRDGIRPNDLHYEGIDPDTGRIIETGDSPYHGDYTIKLPILISPDDLSVLLGSGDIYNAQTLNWEKSLGMQFDYGVWLDSGEVITLRTVDGATRLDHFNSNQNWSSEQDFDGVPVGIFADNGKVFVVTHTDGSISVTEYRNP